MSLLFNVTHTHTQTYIYSESGWCVNIYTDWNKNENNKTHTEIDVI